MIFQLNKMINEKVTATLGHWYGNPMEPNRAAKLLDMAQERKQEYLRRGHASVCCGLQIMIAKFWLGQPIEEDRRSLQVVTANTAHGRALLALIYGQLLMSRRLSGAMDHLEKGFSTGRLLFKPDDYFLVFNRHRVLAQLPLSEKPFPAEPLDSLLTSARVIQQLRESGGERPRFSSEHKDTFD